MEAKSYSELLEDMKNCMIAGGSEVTDFNEGSNIMTIFEATARPIEQGYIDTRNGYANNLRAIPYSVFDFQRKNGQKATANVKFTRNKATSLASSVPANTRISDGNGHFFTTTSIAVIPANETVSDVVGAVADEVGLAYNVAENTITTIESSVSNEIIAVTNIGAAQGGLDEETDTQMLKRFKYYINGLQGSNKYGIMAGVLARNDVRSVGIEEYFPPQGIYNFRVYVDDGTGGLTTESRNAILDLINGTDTESNPGLRAAGVNVDVQAAVPKSVVITLTATIFRAEEARVRSDITTKLQEYVNGLGIHENVILSSIIVLMKQIAGVTDVSGVLLNSESDNINIGNNEIARFTSVDITIVNQ